MGDDPFFGYHEAALRQPAYTLPSGVDSGWYYSPDNSVSYQETPAPDDNPKTLEDINFQIMHEQPGTADYRADQWAKVSLLLSAAKTGLHDKVAALAEHWESPAAKKMFLDKVGETLAYLDLWQEAAANNSYALRTLAEIMREAQSDMRELYQEYQDSEKESYKAEAAVSRQPGYAPAAWREARSQEKERYDQKARELASDIAQRYAPVIQRLENGHAKKMQPLNAVAHPGAYGAPTFPMPAPFAGPGGAPPAPPPPGPPPAPNGGPKGGPPPAPGPPPRPKPRPDLKHKPDPPNAPNPPPAPNAPPVPESLTNPQAPVAPTPPAVPNAPGLPPEVLAALGPLALTGLPTAFQGRVPEMPATPNGLGSLKTPPVAQASLNAAMKAQTSASSFNGLYPPGTISPPPGVGAPPQLKQPGKPQQNAAQQGKVLGQRPPSGLAEESHPPASGARGAAAAAHGAATRRQSSINETPEAFRPPATGSAPVLDNKRNRGRNRPGGATEAPAARAGAPDATSPVLSNPHRTGPAKTYSEKRKERRLARLERKREQETSGLAAGLPPGTAPVLDGRPARETASLETPGVLLGRDPAPAVRDEHARPEVQADRATRAPQQQTEAGTPAEQSAWDVATPGGPVVAGGAKEQQYRPEPPAALGGGR